MKILNGRSDEAVNSDNIETIKGTGWTDETIVTNAASIDNITQQNLDMRYVENKYPGFYKSKGFLVDDFYSGWEARDAYGVLTVDTDKSKYGRGSLHVSGNTADQNVEIIKDISISFAELKAIQGFWVYLYDSTAMNGIGLYASSLEGTVTGKRFSVFKACNVMKVGWNFIKIFESDWTNTGEESWDNTMLTLAVRGTKNAGQTVNFNIGGWVGNVISEPAILIEFDDCLKSVYNEGFKYMASQGLRGTVHLIGGRFTHEDYMNLPEFTSAKENGWTIGNHAWSHTDLRTFTKSEQTVELNNTRDLIVSNGLGDGLHVAYPFGYYNADTLAVMTENGYKTGRQVGGEANNVIYGSPEFPYSMTCLSFDNTKTLTNATDALADIKAKQNVGRFLFHELGAVAGANTWAISDFRTLIDAIVADGIKVITSDELYYYL
jgi:peptidoglycan/xylan/chitin deacetylase (PgdA/CDA1 family)